MGLVYKSPEKTILRIPKYCMMLVGIWKLELNINNDVARRVYDIYSAFVRIYFPLFVSSLCIQLITSISADKNLEDIFQELSYIIIFSIAEVGAILCQKGDFKEIIFSIIEEERKILDTRDGEVLSYHTTQIKFWNAINLTIVVSVIGTGTSIAAENLWKRLEVGKYNNECNQSTEKPFPFELYLYKFDPYKHPNVMLGVSYFAIFINIFLIISTKIVFISCMVFTSSSLRKLQIGFRKTTPTSTRLVDLIRQHQRVIRFVGKLNASIKYMILMEYLLNSLNIAAVSVQFIAFEQGVQISPLLYLVYLLVQIFALGWSANEIQIQVYTG